MENLEVYDLTGSLRDAAELAGCSHHTVGRYGAARSAGALVPGVRLGRASVVDPFRGKKEELVEQSRGNICRMRPTGSLWPWAIRGRSARCDARWPGRGQPVWRGGWCSGRGCRSRGCGFRKTSARDLWWAGRAR